MLVAGEHASLDFRHSFSSWMIKKPPSSPPLCRSEQVPPLHSLYPRNAKQLHPPNCHRDHTFHCWSCRLLFSALLFRALNLLVFLNPPLGIALTCSTKSSLISTLVQQRPFSGGENIWGTHKATSGSPQSPAALKLCLREELAFFCCWRATKHFFDTAPLSENFSSLLPAHTRCLRDGAGQRRCSPSHPKPSRIFIPSFHWTTDWILKRVLTGGGTEDGHPTLSQQAKISAQKQFCLTDLDMPAWSRGKTRPAVVYHRRTV